MMLPLARDLSDSSNSSSSSSSGSSGSSSSSSSSSSTSSSTESLRMHPPEVVEARALRRVAVGRAARRARCPVRDGPARSVLGRLPARLRVAEVASIEHVLVQLLEHLRTRGNAAALPSYHLPVRLRYLFTTPPASCTRRGAARRACYLVINPLPWLTRVVTSLGGSPRALPSYHPLPWLTRVVTSVSGRAPSTESSSLRIP